MKRKSILALHPNPPEKVDRIESWQSFNLVWQKRPPPVRAARQGLIDTVLALTQTRAMDG